MKIKYQNHNNIAKITIKDEDGEDETFELPYHVIVCQNCAGKGKHVHRGVDGNGLTSSDFYEDPEFAEEYFGGFYDVVCETCHGEKVELMISDQEEGSKWYPNYEKYLDELEFDYEYGLEDESERRYFGY